MMHRTHNSAMNRETDKNSQSDRQTDRQTDRSTHINVVNRGAEAAVNKTVTFLCPARREGCNKRCFCPSVRSSVCMSVRQSRTQLIIRETKGLARLNLEWRFPTLDATRTPVSRSNGQRSGLQTGGGIPCRPNPAATLLVVNAFRG